MKYRNILITLFHLLAFLVRLYIYIIYHYLILYNIYAMYIWSKLNNVFLYLLVYIILSLLKRLRVDKRAHIYLLYYQPFYWIFYMLFPSSVSVHLSYYLASFPYFNKASLPSILCAVIAKSITLLYVINPTIQLYIHCLITTVFKKFIRKRRDKKYAFIHCFMIM